MRPVRCYVAAGVLGAALLAGAAGRGERDVVAARFLEPEAFRCEPGRALVVRIAGGEKAWGGEDVRWMMVRVAGTQQNLDGAPLDGSAHPIATLETAGVGVVGIDLKACEAEVGRDALRAFLKARGSPEDAATLAGTGETLRVRRIESFKTIVRSGAPGAEAGQSAATGRTVQDAEICPLLDPAALHPTTALPVRLYVRGTPAPGARVLATHAASGAVREGRADASGTCTLTLDTSGEWRMEFHTLGLEGEGKERRPVLRSATLTFELPDAPAPSAKEGAAR